MTYTNFLNLMTAMLEDTYLFPSTWLVGGVLRDMLLGKELFYDYDLCVEIPYGSFELANYLLSRLVFPSYKFYEEYGTASLRSPYMNIDISITRKEVYQKGRRYPKTEFCPLAEDVWRRDFTINALYQNLHTREIIDPSEMGMADIDSRKIRTLYDPYRSFKDDPLRILRALRFAAKLNFTLEEETERAAKELSHLCNKLPKKNIAAEKEKQQEIRDQDKLKYLLSQYAIEI